MRPHLVDNSIYYIYTIVKFKSQNPDYNFARKEKRAILPDRPPNGKKNPAFDEVFRQKTGVAVMLERIRAADAKRLRSEELVFFAYLAVDVRGYLGVGAQIFYRLLPALTYLLVIVAEPAPALHDEPVLHAEVDETAEGGYPRAVHDVELRHLERRRDFVFDYFGFDAVAYDVAAVLYGLRSPDVDADRGVEFERLAPRRGLGAAVHHAHLLAELVDEDDGTFALGGDGGELAQSL